MLKENNQYLRNKAEPRTYIDENGDEFPIETLKSFLDQFVKPAHRKDFIDWCRETRGVSRFEMSDEDFINTKEDDRQSWGMSYANFRDSYKDHIFESENKRITKRELCDEVEVLINEAIEKAYNESTKLSLMDYGVCIDKYGTKVFMLSGGLNGPGKWNEYLQTLAIFVVELIDKLQATYGKDADVWLVDLKNDCADDIFYPVFGFHLGEDLDETESVEWQEQNTWQADEGEEECPFEYDKCTDEWDCY